MWVDCLKRLPDAGGEYRVIRRPYKSGLPHYYDFCTLDPKGLWRDRRGRVVNTVEWWEIPEDPDALRIRHDGLDGDV